jgi:serine/threonine-protein kinase
MATVYLGRISGAGGFQRFVAIKRLHPHLAREPEFIQMFLDEARLAARIHHPNVVPILEIGASEQGYYIVMEYVEGDTLGRLIGQSARSEKPLPIPVATRILIDTLTGLHAAHDLADDDGHALGIVHRDVSPQNVLVGVDGSSRLSDFGVARATSKLSTTQNGQLKGKLAYMAPEQARGIKDIDRRADIFAAGVVFWEALTGRRLFVGDGEADTFNKVLNEPIPLLGTAMPAVHPALETVLAKALHRDREGRYATAAAFADDVEHAMREIGAVGTHKDVSAYLYAVLGSEIAQQRDAVRSWIARDPSRPRGLTPQPPGVTGASQASSVSGVTRGATPERTPSSGKAIAAAPSSSDPLPRGLASQPRLPDALPAPRARAWPWLVVVAATAIAGAAFMHWGRGSSHQASAPPPVTTTPSAAALAPTMIAVAPTRSPGPISPAEPRASAEAPAPAVAVPVRPSRSPRGQEVPPVPPAKTSASAAGGSAPVPDDIMRNPYR